MLLYYFPLHLRKRLDNSLTNRTAVESAVDETIVVGNEMDAAAIVEHDAGAVVDDGQMKLQKPYRNLLLR